MWPPHSVKTWPTPACLGTRATSRPPVSSGTKLRHHLGREALDLLALLGGRADRIEDDVVAAGGAETLELLGALLGCADNPVLARQRLEVLRIAPGERLGPHRFRRFPVAAHGDEGQMRRGEALQLAAGRSRRRADLVEALRVALRLHDVGNPAIALTPRASQRGFRAAADPDRRAGLLHRLGIERHARELREASLEARRGVAPQGADDVDPLGHARATLSVRHAGYLELPRILAADAYAEDHTTARQHVERR